MGHNIFKENGLFFIPLGGSEQFGVNLNVYVNDGDMLAIDCGIGFADERFPGIDLLLPDPDFIECHKEYLKGIIITHAHEDHIGALAYMWERFPVPVYATPFTAEILRKKFEERGIKRPLIEKVQPSDVLHIGPFKVQFASVSHSVPQSCSLIIETAYGRIAHSGDWNLDPAPVVGTKTDEKLFKDAGEKGILAYVGDSTNAEVDGYSGSESDVAEGLESEFANSKGRIAITTFSSNIGRIISIVKAAHACGRSVAVIGRSLHRMIGTAMDLGMFEGLPSFIDESEISCLPDDQVVVIMTGSQGEYRAALAKVARGDFRDFKLQRGDTVIFSARAIPGNETAINQVKNNLSASGVNVITPRDTRNKIHVSGHPCRNEIAQMLQWLKPQLVVPIHGERIQLAAHAEFAKECQVAQTIVPNNGSVIKLAPNMPEIIDHVETDVLAVDQKRVIKSNHGSITQRRKLQYTGVIHVTVILNGHGEVVKDPKLDIIGLLDKNLDDENEIESQIFNEVLDLIEDLSFEDRSDEHLVSEEVRIGVRRFCQHKLGIKPNTTVHVVYV